MEDKICLENLEELIKDNMAFLIKTVSSFTGRYVQIENDDEFSVALIAFSEAVEKYDSTKGLFFPFAKVVIESRLKNYYTQTNSKFNTTSLEDLEEKGVQFTQEDDSKLDLQEEIILYKKELQYFNLTFEDLVDKAPKHADTRHTAFMVAKKSSTNEEIVKDTYMKRRLPVTKISIFTSVSEKIIKHSRQFILATLVIFVKRFPLLQSWLKETRCSHVS